MGRQSGARIDRRAAGAAVRFAGREGPLQLLVLGGSQGARRLNTAMPEVLRRRGSRLPVMVRHQCGEKHFEKARAAYLAAGIDADVEPFIDETWPRPTPGPTWSSVAPAR